MNQSQNVFKCKICGLKYSQKQLALKCESWCKNHKSCNLNIVKFAIKENEKSRNKN